MLLWIAVARGAGAGGAGLWLLEAPEEMGPCGLTAQGATVGEVPGQVRRGGPLRLRRSRSAQFPGGLEVRCHPPQ